MSNPNGGLCGEKNLGRGQLRFRKPVHVGVPLNLAALHIEALALARLAGRRHSAITVNCHLA